MTVREWTIEEWFEHGRKWRAAGWAPSSSTWSCIMLGRRGDYSATTCVGHCRPDGTVHSDYFVEWVPDMRDSGTRGHALDQVRRHHNVPSLQCGHVGGWGPDWNQWEVSNPAGKGRGCALFGSQPTEHEALLHVREAAA